MTNLRRRGGNRMTSTFAAAALVSAAMLVALVACSSGSDDNTLDDSTPAGGATPGSSSASSSGASSAGTASDPAAVCELVTSAEAEAALGKPVNPGKGEVLGPAATCTYQTTDFANGTADGAALTVTFIAESGVSASDWDAVWATNGHEAVPGLGESAWFLGGMLNIYDQGATLAVSIVSLQTEATLDQLEPVARLALGRI